MSTAVESVFPMELLEKMYSSPQGEGFLKGMSAQRERSTTLMVALRVALENVCSMPAVRDIQEMLSECESAMTRSEWEEYKESLEPVDLEGKGLPLESLLFLAQYNLAKIIESMGEDAVEPELVYKVGVAIYLSVLPCAFPVCGTGPVSADRQGVITSLRIINKLGFPI